MKKITKIFNYVFRGSIAASFITAVLLATAGGSLFSAVQDTDDALEKLGESIIGELGGLSGKSTILMGLLILGVILSVLAFKSSGTVVSVLRTIVMILLAVAAIAGKAMLGMSEVVARYTTGQATKEEYDAVVQIVDILAKEGQKETAVISAGTMGGVVIAMIVAAVLGVLVITSVISVVKTVKADSI